MRDLSRDGTFSFNLLERIYAEDGQEGYDRNTLSAVMAALEKFGDLPSVAEVYSVPRVAAQAMTIGMRPGFSIDIGTLKPDGTPWNLEDDLDYRLLRMWRLEEKPFPLVRRATHSLKCKLGTGHDNIRTGARR